MDLVTEVVDVATDVDLATDVASVEDAEDSAYAT